MPLPIKPTIPSALLREPRKRPLKGQIEPGEVFAWEPDLPHARELVIVRRVYTVRKGEHWAESWVETWDMDYAQSHHNEESRFREAAVRTTFNRFPAERPPMVLEPLPDGVFRLRGAA
jgi:hypothetical protein